MQPSSIRVTSPRTAHRPLSRRARLLLGSALCGAVAVLAQPALAQTLPGIPGGGNIIVSSGGGAPIITAPDPNTLNIDLNAPRTVINWSSLHLSSGDTMNFQFDAASNIVLNKTTSQIAIDNGAVVTGQVGGTTGGNIWFYSPQGVIVSPGAVMSAGGFLFAGGTGLNDANFVNAADPAAMMRAASNGLIRLTTVSTATSATITAAGDVVLHASSGALNVSTAYGRTAMVNSVSGSITASEITATQGAAWVLSGGLGATVTQITGVTGVTVSSLNNTSVGAATTTGVGDILITSSGTQASLTLGNSGRDLTLSADSVFASTLDAARDVFVTGVNLATVTNRIFAGDDIEITADGNVTTTGAYLRSTGVGATDDAHILLRSTAGFVINGNTVLTEGTGIAAGDIILQGATTASLSTAASSRDIIITGPGGASLANGEAARDIILTATGGTATVNIGAAGRDLAITGQAASLTRGTAERDAFVTASNGDATIVTSATAGDDVEVTATGGNVNASLATLKSTGVGATDDAHVRVQSNSGSVAVGTAITQGTGAAAGDIDIRAAATAALGEASATGRLVWLAAGDLNLSGTYAASTGFSLNSSGGDIIQTTGSLIGPDLTAQAFGRIALTGANMLDSAFNLSAQDIVLNNDQDLSVSSFAGGDITISTTTGALTVTGSIVSMGDLTLTGAQGLMSNGGLFGVGLVNLTAVTGDALVAEATSSGSIRVEALNGAATLRNAVLGGSLDVIATGTATLGADTLAGIALGYAVIRTGGAGTLNVASSGGDARVFLNSLNTRLTSVTANTTTGTASVGAGAGFGVDTVEGFNVLLDASTGTVDVTNLTVNGGDYTARAGHWSGAALNPGGTIRNLSLTDTAGGLVLTHALTATGDLTLSSSDGVASAYDLTAGGDVTVTAAGDIDLVSAAAGDDITIASTGGQAILRRADLTGVGAGRDLSISALNNAVLGDPSYAMITSDNIFTRSGGGAGAAEIRSTSGDAMAHLQTSEAIDLLEGAAVDVTIVSGPGVFGAITALTNNVYVEVLDGDMTVGAVSADFGDVQLYGAGGDLTILGAVHGAGTVHVETDGLLDGALAGLISSDADLELIGGDVDLGRITAVGTIEVIAETGDAMVQLAQAGQSVVMASLQGNATLRGAEAPDAVVVMAQTTATFGADDRNAITVDNYIVTDAPTGPSTGLQVMSFGGDAVVNIQSASNGIGLVAAAIDGDVTVVQSTGDLEIDEIAAYGVTLEAMNGALDVGSVTSSGGDYIVTAQDFRGNALTPVLFFGTIRDVTVTDTLGDLNLNGASLYAGRNLTLTAQDGAVVGLGSLTAGAGLGDGAINVFAEGITLDTVVSDGDVTLDGGTGRVDVVNLITVAGDYDLRGADFSSAALAPTGTKAGSWAIVDTVGDFDFTGQILHYGGSIDALVDFGEIIGDGVISDTSDIRVQAAGGRLGLLSAVNGDIAATASTGDMVVESADVASEITIQALTTGTAALGGARLRGPGNNRLTVQSSGGDAVLGALTPGAITTGNAVTSTGAVTTVAVTAAGRVDVNLDHVANADLTTVSGDLGADVRVLTGDLRILDLASANGAVRVDGPDGTLRIDTLTAGASSRVNGGGETRLVTADVEGDLSVVSATGDLHLGGVAPGGAIIATGDLSLAAANDIRQNAVLTAASLSADADGSITLLGDNNIQRLGAIHAGGGFAFNTISALVLANDIDAAGQTVDLRANGAITQNSGIITAGLLAGRAVGGARFGADNRIQRLGDFTNSGGALLINNAEALTFAGRVWSTGTVEIRSHGGMTFANTGTVGADGTGDAVVLASNGVFTNQRGVDAVTASNAAGRWLIYTQATGAPNGPTSGNSFGGLAGLSFYGSAYDFNAGGFSLAPNAGNRFVYAYQPTLLVMPDGLTMVYNGQIPTITTTITGLINGDRAADAWTGSPIVIGADNIPGSYVLTVQAGTLASDMNYAFSFGTATLQIDSGDTSYLRSRSRSPDFDLDRDPSAQLTVALDCPDEDCLRP